MAFEGNDAFCSLVCRTLANEWHAITHSRAFKHWETQAIPPPHFVLSDNKSFLGRWTFPENTIEINRRLVYEHPWYAVLDVLYHEIAHQITHYLYPNNTEPAHGAMFRQVCARIGANPSASSSISELDCRIFISKDGATADPLLDKIRKLMTLAEKGDEHEAEVALAKAAEIMGKYGIEKEDVDDDGKYVTISIGKPFKTSSSENAYMSSLLNQFFSVRTITGQVVDSHTGDTSKITYICGTTVHVKIASYVYDAIQSHIELAWLKYCKDNFVNSSLVRRRRDFAIGALQSLIEKLSGELEHTETMALIHVGDADLEKYYHRRFPYIVTTTHRSQRDQNAFNAGVSAGKNMNIHDGITIGKGPGLLKQ